VGIMKNNKAKYSSYNRDLSVTIAGLENTGKTLLVNHLVSGQVSKTYSTFGVNQELFYTKGIVLGITDLGGRESFRKTLWKSFISRSDALIYITDITKMNELSKSKEWFLHSISWLKEDKPVLVLFNKWTEKFKKDEIDAIIAEFKKGVDRTNINYLPTSLASGENVDKTVDWLASSIIQELILDEIVVEMFIAYVKTEKGIIEMRVTTPKTTTADDVLSPIIRYKFNDSLIPILEHLQYNERHFIMAADSEISCWLVTSKMAKPRSSNLLIKLLVEFVKEIQGLRQDKGKLTEPDLSKFLISNLIDKQIFWSKASTPLFEI